MGQCYAIPMLIEIPNPHPHHQIENENRSCVMCLENVTSNKIYIKCSKCNIYLHTLCSLEYKSTQSANEILLCPVCKHNNSLNIYDNGVYNCKLL